MLQVDKNVVVIVVMEIAIALAYYFCLKRILDKDYEKSEKKFDVEYGMLCREVQSEVIRTSPFEKNGKVTDFDWYDSGLKDFREKDIERDKTDKGMLQKKWMTIQSLIDFCEMKHIDVGASASVGSVFIAMLAVGVAIAGIIVSLLTGLLSEEVKREKIYIISLIYLLTLFILFAIYIFYYKIVKKNQSVNRVFKERKMLLMGVCREIETKISELEEEERNWKRRRSGVNKKRVRTKVLKSTTQIKFFGKEILRMDLEKGSKK